MIWNRDGVTWYSSDVIEKIKKAANTVLFAGHCNNCDGVGSDFGCKDTSCGVYQANKILEIIKGA